MYTLPGEISTRGCSPHSGQRTVTVPVFLISLSAWKASERGKTLDVVDTFFWQIFPSSM